MTRQGNATGGEQNRIEVVFHVKQCQSALGRPLVLTGFGAAKVPFDQDSANCFGPRAMTPEAPIRGRICFGSTCFYCRAGTFDTGPGPTLNSGP